MATYEEVKKDHSYLWSIGAANDMTGGYVDSEDLDRMLSTPTKKMAKSCLMNQIEYWFQMGIEPRNGNNAGIPAIEFENDYPKIREIAEKYGIDY